MTLRLGIRSALVWSTPLLGAVVAASACSSGSNNVVQEEDGGGTSSSSGGSSGTSSGTSSSGSPSSSGTSSSSGVGSSGVSSSSGSTSSSSGSSSGSSGGEGGSCPMVTDAYIGVKITFMVEWGQGGASGTSVASDPGGPAPVNIWLLSHETGGTSFTGTAQPCGTTLPDLELNAAGDIAVGGVALGASGLVNPAIPDSTFAAITRTYANSGTQGFNIGDAITTTPTLGLLGLSNSSAYDNPTTAWPAYCASNATCTGVTCSDGTCSGGPGGPFMGSDITDDDMDGNPGVTATPLTGSATCPTYTTNTGGNPSTPSSPCTLYQPPTAVGLGGSAPAADKVYVVSRQRFALSGIRSDCQKGSGTASITLFDNHVVGCHIAGGGQCTSAQVQFLDQNRPIYTDMNNNAFSESSPANNGTVEVYQFAQGTTPTCADVKTQLP